MTEQELILRQSELGSDSFLVTKLGNFYSAYDCGAFALARATGYSVMRRPRRGGRFVLTTGFPVGRLDAVLSMIGAAGGCVVYRDECSFVFSGITGSVDEDLVKDAVSKSCSLPTASASSFDMTDKVDTESQVISLIRSFNLSCATPIDAINFIARLKNILR